MQQEKNSSRHSKLKRSDNVIPDYDYLFEESTEKNKKKKSRFFVKLMRLNKKPLILSSLVYILQAAPTWILPLVSSNIINIVTAALTSAEGVTSAAWLELAVNAGILALFILQNVPSTVLRWNIVSKMLRRTSAGIKSSVVRKLQGLSITYHKDMQSGSIQSKFLKDTDSIDALFSNLVHSFIPNVIGLIVSTAISIYKNGWVALFFVLIIPCNVALGFAFRKKISSTNRNFRLKTEDMSNRLSTMLSMMMVTKSHGLEQTEISSVNKSITRVTGAGLKVDKTTAHFGAWSWVVSTLLSSLCLLFCACMALLGQIKVGDIVLYQSMFSQISGSVSGLINLLPSMGTGLEALNSVSEIMNATDVEMNIGKSHVPTIEGSVEFKNVSYRYPGTEQYVVNDFSLNVKSGECIAVVGASGSGKSTIMNLIIGFLIPEKGDIFIDGKSIKDFNLSEYRHHISVVPQNSILFAGSIKDNITYGLDHYSEEDLQKVIEMANLSELIKELPDGLDTDIGEHGDKLSGGQKQRITIARALIRNPRILILDEATSALDNISEYHVQKAISSSIKGRTTFIVAHRLSTIRDADRIVVMEQGVAAEIGTYQELMDKKGKFYELKCLNEMNLKTAEEGLN